MGFNFKSILQDVGKFFQSKPAEEVEGIAIPALETVFPGLTPLLTGGAAIIGKIESDAQQTGMTPDEIAGAALTLGEQIFTEYETAKGVKIPEPNKTQFLALLAELLEQIPQLDAAPSSGPALVAQALPVQKVAAPVAVINEPGPALAQGSTAPVAQPAGAAAGHGGGTNLTQAPDGSPAGAEAKLAKAAPAELGPDDVRPAS